MAGMRVPALAAAFAAVVPEVGASDWCTQPTGGNIPLVYSGCVKGTNRCFAWMNAQCDAGWCKCKDDECIMQGQCVPKGSCPSVTGGTCVLQGCDRWRNASCSEKELSNHEAHCLCGPGTCPIKGECRPPGTCAKATDGTCNVIGCHAWRKAMCSVSGLVGPSETAKCMCGEGACPVNGECVKQGGCPRYAGSSCTVFRTTGLFGCSVGECSEAGWCECREGECFVDGQCVQADAASIELSRKWGRAQEEAAGGESSGEVIRDIALAFTAAFTMSAGCVAIKQAGRREEALPSAGSGYEHLEG